MQLATQTYVPPFVGVTSTAISYVGGPTVSSGATSTAGSQAASPTNTGPVSAATWYGEQQWLTRGLLTGGSAGAAERKRP